MNASPSMKSRLAIVFGGLLILDFILVIVMLATDKNLQTDFGGSAPYYIHWYAGLCIGVVTLLVALFILALLAEQLPMESPPAWVDLESSAGRYGPGSWLSACSESWPPTAKWDSSRLANLPTISLASLPTPDHSRTFPWLYDAVIGMFIVSAIVGVVAVMHIRAAQQTGSTSALDQ